MSSHLYKYGTDNVGFSPSRQNVLALKRNTPRGVERVARREAASQELLVRESSVLEEQWGGAYPFVACLGHLTIDHASLSRRSTVLGEAGVNVGIFLTMALICAARSVE